MAIVKSDDQNFKQEIEKNDKVIVKFFADWCGSCRLFHPKFRRMSEDDENQDIAFLDINAEENPEARKWAGVTNLPYFAVVRNGEIIEGDYTAKEDTVQSMINKLHQ